MKTMFIVGIVIGLLVMLSISVSADCYTKSDYFQSQGLFRLTCEPGYVADSCFSLDYQTQWVISQDFLPERQCRVWINNPNNLAYVTCCRN
jgi:hypothetical protein